MWEWVSGGKPQARVLRGGSFVDSLDGKFNHVVMVSTRQENSGDSTASNAGFRCAASLKAKDEEKKGRADKEVRTDATGGRLDEEEKEEL